MESENFACLRPCQILLGAFKKMWLPYLHSGGLESAGEAPAPAVSIAGALSGNSLPGAPWASSHSLTQRTEDTHYHSRGRWAHGCGPCSQE